MGNEFKKAVVVLGVFRWGSEYEALQKVVGITPDYCHDAVDAVNVADRVKEARLCGRKLFIKAADLEVAERALESMMPNSRSGKEKLLYAKTLLAEGKAIKVLYSPTTLKMGVQVESVEFPRSTPSEAVETGDVERLAA